MKFVGSFLVCALWVARAQTFEVAEASIAEEQKAMAAGRVTSKALVQAYLNRIAAFDTQGARINAMIAMNPNELSEAEALDRERAEKGPRGPLHGIPIVVKDNYGTADMPTTAGTLALLGFVPVRDAFQVSKLREAGAVIIGKTNLHELASGITTISSAGGQTLNPYDLSRNPGGSSGGTGAAIAASFAAAGMGSDTCGSIRIPSSHNSLVGLRTTKGMSSIRGIVPLSVSQDVGGPLARSVADLAVILDATIGEDAGDAATHLPTGQVRPKFSDALKAGSLKEARIGILEPLFGDASDDQEVIRVVRVAIEEMKKEGATGVPVQMPELMVALEGTSLIDFEFKEDLASYLAQNGIAPVHSLAEIVENGLFHASLEGVFKRRLAAKGRDSDEYRQALAKRVALAQMMMKVMEEQKLDALVYPAIRRKAARVGDAQGGSTCQLSASTGFPAISMPAGFTADGLPVGVELFGRPMDDAKLVSFAYAYEQAAHHRRAPANTPALGSGTKALPLTWQSSAKAEGGAGMVRAQFSFDPATSELSYDLKATGFGENGIVSATVHRAATDGKGPAILVLSSHAFRTLTGTEKLASVDCGKLLAGELYLRVATGGAGGGSLRVALRPSRQPSSGQ